MSLPTALPSVSDLQLLPLVDSTGLRHDADALRARIERDGYLYLPRLLSPGDVLELRYFALETAEALDWLEPGTPRGAAVSREGIALGGYDDPRWIEFMRRVVIDERFERLRLHPDLALVLAAVFNGPYAPTRGDVCRVVSSDVAAHTTPPHQDCSYIEGADRLHTAWLPLGDCPLSLGPLAVLAGSHRAGLLPHSGGFSKITKVVDHVTWHTSPFAMGDVIIVSGYTVHRALPHRAGRRLRLSVDYRFAAVARQ